MSAIASVLREKLRAFHGSPYSFDRFSTDQIGTGEGAQAYGRGLYFAEREGTAESYRDSLTPRDFEYEDYLVAENRKAMENEDYLRAEMLERAMMHDTPADFRDLANNTDYDEDFRQAAADMADEIDGFRKEDGSPVNFGSMYEVEIDASPEELLDYDLPLKEQSPQVQKAIDDLMVLNGVESYSPEGTKVYLNTGVTGDSRGHEILQHFTGIQGREGAPEALKFAGIKGVKYADAQTRFSKGPKTSNFVIFDDNLITIMRQYGVPLAVAAQMVAPEEAQASPRSGRTPVEPGAAKEFGAGLLSAGMDYIDGMRATVPYDPYGAMQGTQLYDDVQSGMTTEQSLPREQQATSTYSNPFLRGILEEEYMQDRERAARARSAGNIAGNTALLFSPL